MEYSSKIERAIDLMLMLGWNEIVDHLPMANSAHWSCIYVFMYVHMVMY